MRIQSINIKNFRSFKNEHIDLSEYCCFVGCNGAGKSTVFNALNVFFRQYKDSKTDLSKLTEDDFHHKDTSTPIEITVTFDNLSTAAIDSLSDYVRQRKLIVTAKAEFDQNSGIAEVKQYGSRLGINDFRKWFEAEKSKSSVAELKKLYADLTSIYTDLPSAASKGAMQDALREHEASNESLCTPIPSEDQFYGVSKGSNRLAPHIQWVFIPASKDLSQEAQETKGSALGQLLLRAVRAKVNFSQNIDDIRKSIRADYEKMLTENQGALEELSESLQTKLRVWSNPNVSASVHWRQDQEKSIKIEEPWAQIQIGEKGFESELSRFGHGMQRSYMLTLLQELAETDDANSPTLVMAIEEPELYQHPPQAKYLAAVLQELSKENSQILVCTHSPYFIPGDNFEGIRIVREAGTPPYSTTNSLTYQSLGTLLNECGERHVKEQGIVAKLYPSLRPETSEMFFCQRLILVEGLEDVAYISSYIELMNKVDEFRKGGFHIVPFGGKSSIIKPLAIAKLLDIRVFVVCDADTNKTSEGEVGKHKKDNKVILKLLGMNEELKWPDSDVISESLCMWKTNITEMVSTELGNDWSTHMNQARNEYGNVAGVDKNPLVVSRALETAWENDLKSASLENVIHTLLKI